MLRQQSARADDQEQEQEHKGGDVAPHRAGVPLRLLLDDTEQEPAGNRAGDRSHAAEHHGDQPLEGRLKPEFRRNDLFGRHDEVAGDAADGGRQDEGKEDHAAGVDAHEQRGVRVFGHRPHREPETRAVEQLMQGDDEDRRQAQHDQMFEADGQAGQFDELEVAEGGEFVGPVGKGDRNALFELHPDRETRDHGGDGSPLLDRPETQPFDIGAGDCRAQNRSRQHGVPACLELDEQEGAEKHADHDRRAVGQVEAAQDTEDQREADRQQGVARTHGDAVEGVLDEIENPVSPRPPGCARATSVRPIPDRPAGSPRLPRGRRATRRKSRGPVPADRNGARP